MRRRQIGVLALQGGFARHAKAMAALNTSVCYVRYPHELDVCDALIIPGGESTTISKQMDLVGLQDAITAFGKTRPIFGTCAGLILLSKNVTDPSIKTCNLLDVGVVRNGYGSQIDSFATSLSLGIDRNKQLFHAVFIRAPRISSVGENVKVLASFQNGPVLIQEGHHMGATFHPELTNDLRIHRYFLSLIG